MTTATITAPVLVAPSNPTRDPLIGKQVWFFRWDWDKPLEPRAGIINGINHDGTPNVTVFHDHTLDQFNRSMLPVMSYPGVPVVQQRPTKPGLGKHVCMLVEPFVLSQTPPAVSRK